MSLFFAGAALGISFGQAPAGPPDGQDSGSGLVQVGQDVPDAAWIRVAHLAPNLGTAGITLQGIDEANGAASTGAQELEYGVFTEFVQVPTGNYLASLADGVPVEEELSLGRGNYYTLVLMGLLSPEQVGEEQSQENGFFDFLLGLFSMEEGTEQLGLQFHLLEEELSVAPEEGVSNVRVFHAAPGTDDISIGAEDSQEMLVEAVSFGQVSGYLGISRPLEEVQVFLSSSDVALANLGELELVPGYISTVYLTGTPVEETPVRLISSSLPPVELGSQPGEEQGSVADGGP